MIGSPGPFRIIKGDQSGCVDAPIAAPRRRYLCPNYSNCLNLAAALNWDNFTCRGCSGEIDESLMWRARHAMKRDDVVATICDLPQIESHAKSS